MSLPATTSNGSRGRALGRAAESGDAARVGELLAEGAAVDARLEGGATALMRAAARGYADVARALIDAGADVNARRSDGFSPLVLAVFFGHEEVVRLLLERGAHAALPTRLGVTARGWAESRGFAAIGELLKHAPEPPAESLRPIEPTSEVAVAAAEALPSAVRVESREARREALPAREAEARPTEPAGPDETRPFRPKTYEPQFQAPARGFLGSWQASVGVFLLVAACGVAGFAVWQNRQGRAAKGAPTPAPAAAPQAAQPLPAQTAADLAAQPTPSPSPEAQGGALFPEMPGAVVVEPYPTDQPALARPDLTGAGVSTTAPAVISGSDATAAGAGSRRDARETRDEGPASTPPPGRRDEERRADDSTGRDRPPAAEFLPPPAPPASNPPPAPSPTPRSRVIQWPP